MTLKARNRGAPTSCYTERMNMDTLRKPTLRPHIQPCTDANNTYCTIHLSLPIHAQYPVYYVPVKCCLSLPIN